MAEAFRVQLGSHKDNKIRKIIAETGDLPAVAVIADGLEESEAFDLERVAIGTIGRFDCDKGPLTNKSDGGEGQSGFTHSEETKTLLRQKSADYVRTHGNNFAGKHHTEEAKAKKREASKRAWADPKNRREWSEGRGGENHPNYGQKLSEETRRRISEGQKKSYQDPARLEALRERMRKLNAERGPLANLVTEQGRKNQGKAASERWQDPETRERMLANTIKTWEVTSPDGETVTVKNLRGYMLELGYPASAAGNLAYYGKWRGWKARKVE